MFHLLAMIVVALSVGFGLSWYALTDGRLFGVLQAGPWAAWPDVGSAEPNPYTRAHLARVAGLQLGIGEGLQFTAAADSDGMPLTRDCTYRIQGKTPVAAFWTLSAIGPSGVNLARPDGTATIRSTAIARSNDGAIVLYVGKRLAPLNWLELTGNGPFSLVLTLYDTVVSSGISSAQTTMPAIIKEECL
ncbi:DUF1214 domain-containing protein [Devosia sp.]|uniref:DUF1214 domain-containing protein n=1 Tax=Devosia sp. TaxID=1871048 RepID=UPI0032638ED2